MIQGAKFWDDRNRFFVQTNNPTETFLKATLNNRSGWLESCGPTSALNCISAMGKNVEIICPGIYKPQPEEILMDFFNDPKNKLSLDSIRIVDDNIPKNRVPQYYPFAVYRVFNVQASFRWGLSFLGVARHVLAERPVQICLENPGHYLAVIAYDVDKTELIYNDSWGGRFSDNKGGWHRRMGMAEFRDNVQDYAIVYGV